MQRNTINFMIDVITLLVMLGMVATGLVIRFVLPPGTGGRHGGTGLALWGLGRHDWGDIHYWLAVTLGLLVLVHIALHWNWVCIIAQRLTRPGTPIEKITAKTINIYGIVLLGLIVGAFAILLFIASASVETFQYDNSYSETTNHETNEQQNEHDAYESHDTLDIDIRGSMSLADIELATGVPAKVIVSELGLPDTIPADERLGRLKRRYDFEMHDIREIIEKHSKLDRTNKLEMR